MFWFAVALVNPASRTNETTACHGHRYTAHMRLEQCHSTDPINEKSRTKFFAKVGAASNLRVELQLIYWPTVGTRSKKPFSLLLGQSRSHETMSRQLVRQSLNASLTTKQFGQKGRANNIRIEATTRTKKPKKARANHFCIHFDILYKLSQFGYGRELHPCLSFSPVITQSFRHVSV